MDRAGPAPLAVDGAGLAALAEGRPPPLPHEDPDVVALVHAALTAELAVAAYRLLPGEDGTDLTLCLVPVPGCDPAQAAFTGAAERASRRVLAGAGPPGPRRARGAPVPGGRRAVLFPPAPSSARPPPAPPAPPRASP